MTAALDLSPHLRAARRTLLAESAEAFSPMSVEFCQPRGSSRVVETTYFCMAFI